MKSLNFQRRSGLYQLFRNLVASFAHFLVDDYYCRGSMRCKAHSKSLQKGLTLTRWRSLISTLASLLESALAKNGAVNPLESALAKSLDLKFPGINTYRKR